MKAGEDIQVTNRDPESKTSERLMYRLCSVTRVQTYRYISPTSLHPLLKTNAKDTYIMYVYTKAEKRKAFAAIPDPCTTCKLHSERALPFF